MTWICQENCFAWVCFRRRAVVFVQTLFIMVPERLRMKTLLSQVIVFAGGMLCSLGLIQCAAPTVPELNATTATPLLVVGRALTVLTGPTNRWYGPQVRFFELVRRATDERIRVDVESDDAHFLVKLPAGEYELTRVQINEGPFMAMADLQATFEVTAGGVTYLGTWRFGVDSPRYGRMIVVSAVDDQDDRVAATQETAARFPEQAGVPFNTVLLTPASLQFRLYEVASYPRVEPYFRRHWW